MIENIPLPRLFDDNLTYLRSIRPVSVSINLAIVPLSYANISLPQDENLPARAYVELFTCMGSAGIYRVRSPHDAYGNDITTAELEHAVVEVGDYLVKHKYNEMMPANIAIQTLFSYYGGTKWTLGDISAIGTADVAVQTNYDRVLEAILAVLEQKPDCMLDFDFSTTPWTLKVVARGQSVTAEGRLSRNVTYAKIVYDDTELCTRVYYEYSTTDGSGQPTTQWTYLDAENEVVAQYGLIEREVPTGSGYTQSEALYTASEYLRKHKTPRISIEIGGAELSAITGEQLDSFTIGKLFRLALADYNLTVEKTITGLYFPNVYATPETVTVTLAEEEDTAITFLHDVDSKGGSGGGGGGRKKSDDAWKEYRIKVDQDDYHMGIMSQHLDRAGNILQQAGMDIDSRTGVIIYHNDNERMLQSKLNVNSEAIQAEVTRATGVESSLSGRIQVASDKVSIVVTESAGNYVLNRAAIVASINNGTSNAKIEADAIDLDGYTTGGDVTFGGIVCEQIGGDTATFRDPVALNGGITMGSSATITIGSDVGAMKSFKVDNAEVAKFIGTADVNFDRAAARAEGAAAVVVDLSDGGWVINDADTGDYTRVITPTKDGVAVSSKAITISGQTVWSLGKAKGVQEAKAAVTLSGSWTDNKYTVTNSANSRTKEITITTETGNWSSDGNFDRTITVKENTTVVTTETIRARAVYDVGVNHGWKQAYDNCGRTNNVVKYPKSATVGDIKTETAKVKQTRYSGSTLYIQVATNVYQAYSGNPLYYSASIEWE